VLEKLKVTQLAKKLTTFYGTQVTYYYFHNLPMDPMLNKVNPLEHTAACETVGLAKSEDTQPAVRRLRHRCLLHVILAFCQWMA